MNHAPPLLPSAAQTRKDAELVRLAKQDDESPYSYRAWEGERDTLKVCTKGIRGLKGRGRGW